MHQDPQPLGDDKVRIPWPALIRSSLHISPSLTLLLQTTKPSSGSVGSKVVKSPRTALRRAGRREDRSTRPGAGDLQCRPCSRPHQSGAAVFALPSISFLSHAPLPPSPSARLQPAHLHTYVEVQWPHRARNAGFASWRSVSRWAAARSLLVANT